MHALDGAVFPCIIKVKYTVNGREYTKGKWIGAGKPVPSVGSAVTVLYCESKPSKAGCCNGQFLHARCKAPHAQEIGICIFKTRKNSATPC